MWCRVAQIMRLAHCSDALMAMCATSVITFSTLLRSRAHVTWVYSAARISAARCIFGCTEDATK